MLYFGLESLGDRPMVGLQILDLPIGVRVPVSQPTFKTPAGYSSLSMCF